MPGGFGVAAWWNYREIAVQRERVRTALGYYVPRSLARRLTEQTVAAGANRELLHGTCLVTDAEHYTSVAETLAPTELAALMNDYYRAIFNVVQTSGGEISDTAGDSMIAVWATAEPDATVRLRAAQAALAILEAVDAFNREHPQTRRCRRGSGSNPARCCSATSAPSNATSTERSATSSIPRRASKD